MTRQHKSKGTAAVRLSRFHYSRKRALDRVGVVDVGSNSVRLVIFDGAARSPAYFFNEKIMCGLGAGLPQTGKLNPEGRVRALAALKRFVLLGQGMEVGPLTGVATAAVREASDGSAFCADVLRETGLNLQIASGKEEARLSGQGVLLGWPTARGLMCDIGGSSMELAEISGGEVGRCLTSALGPLKLTAMADDQDGMDRHIQSTITGLRQQMDARYKTLFLVGGSWRAIARLDMERRNYPLKVLHEYEMTPQDLLDTADWISSHGVDEMRGTTGSSKDRMRLVPNAARVLRELVTRFAPDKIAVSSYGIREGMLYEQMPKKLRRRDPLIEACIAMERAAARNPGFGKVLYEFLRPVFKGNNRVSKRLIKAACLLHDVTWRAHPDYRAEVCFDNATRANLGGLDHKGRIFLGVALLNRYKNSGGGAVFASVKDLLDEGEHERAKILGKAMRFGAMLAGPSKKMMGQLKVDKKARVLELALTDPSHDLYGEVVESRFQSLARSLGYETRLTFE